MLWLSHKYITLSFSDRNFIFFKASLLIIAFNYSALNILLGLPGILFFFHKHPGSCLCFLIHRQIKLYGTLKSFDKVLNEQLICVVFVNELNLLAMTLALNVLLYLRFTSFGLHLIYFTTFGYVLSKYSLRYVLNLLIDDLYTCMFRVCGSNLFIVTVLIHWTFNNYIFKTKMVKRNLKNQKPKIPDKRYHCS